MDTPKMARRVLRQDNGGKHVCLNLKLSLTDSNLPERVSRLPVSCVMELKTNETVYAGRPGGRSRD